MQITLAASQSLQRPTTIFPIGAWVAIVAKGAAWVDSGSDSTITTVRTGDREWTLLKPLGHLANKKEILPHFEGIAAAGVNEKSLCFVELFNYEALAYQPLQPPHPWYWQGRGVDVKCICSSTLNKWYALYGYI